MQCILGKYRKTLHNKNVIGSMPSKRCHNRGDACTASFDLVQCTPTLAICTLSLFQLIRFELKIKTRTCGSIIHSFLPKLKLSFSARFGSYFSATTLVFLQRQSVVVEEFANLGRNALLTRFNSHQFADVNRKCTAVRKNNLSERTNYSVYRQASLIILHS